MISHIFAGAELETVGQISEVKVPEEVPEKAGITGYAFSNALL